MNDTTGPDGPRRIAIIGAGPAGLSTAFHLTDPATNPDWRDRYEVDVYQMGWRAGGKGATGRNAEACDRIEEHGIHLFGNFYFNATRMLQAAAAELEWDEHDRYRTMEEMLLPSRASSDTDWIDGRWEQTLSRLMSSEGDPWTGDPEVSPDDIVTSLLEHLARVFVDAVDATHISQGGLLGRLEDVVKHLAGHDLDAWRRRLNAALADERAHPSAPNRAAHTDLVDHLDAMVRLLADVTAARPDSVTIRSVYIQFDLMAALFRGLIDDDVAGRGIDALDGENYREWLARHGASETTLASGYPQALPNTALSYEFGDTTRIPTMSAAAYVNFVTRWLMGHGAGAYFFREGTGDTIIKPIYRLLVQRGVRFHWFHKLRVVEPDTDPDNRTVARVVFDVQATPVGGDYDPLRRLDDGQLVWPNRPLWDRLVEGEALQAGDELDGGGYDLESWWTAWEPVGERVLENGRDFDQVVLATPISTLPHTCSQLVGHDRSGRWAAMTAQVKSTPTQSVQLWLDRTTASLGWDQPLEGHDRYLGGIYGQDLTSYCDFSDLVDEEGWPADNRPKGLVYLIGALSDPDEIPPFDDHDFPKREKARVAWMTVQFLRNANGLLPTCSTSPIDPRSFDFDMLVPHDPDARGRGVNQIFQQYITANIDPNERYTLTVADSMQHRLEAWDAQFDNLVLAGDWIYTGWNVGSFEGAVMGGKLASLVLTGAPTLDTIWGYSFMQQPRPAPTPPRIP